MNELFDLVAAGRRGEAIDSSRLWQLMSRYDQIVLRGAGAFGSGLGRHLAAVESLRGKLVYWDIRAHDLLELHGIPVAIPYSTPYPPGSTLVINCIPNGSTAGAEIQSEIEAHGFPTILSGMGLFEAIICPLNARTGFRPRTCIQTTACNWCSCDLMMNLLKSSPETCNRHLFDTPELSFQIITFVITHKCTLECMHCGQYIPYFRKEAKRHIPLERIARDIDLFFSAIDTVGFVSLIGGEPFAHPELIPIIDKILEKKNFGVLGITTNGICKITPPLLDRLKHERIRVIFSDYTQSLDDGQKKLFADNVEKIKAHGINHTIGMPLWVTPTDLKRRPMPDKDRAALKAGCTAFRTCQTVQNGRYFPCSTAVYVQDHRLGVYERDFAQLDNYESPLALRKELIDVNAQTSYYSCEHCTGGGGLLPVSGQQGTHMRYFHLQAPSFLGTPSQDIDDSLDTE
jgi:hypothetical protein